MDGSSPIPGHDGAMLCGGKSDAAHTPSVVQQIYQVASVLTLAALSYLLISHYILQSVQVVGASMTPTLTDSECYLLNRWVLHVRQPRITDIVVIRDPVDNGLSVKRVIGHPGDTVYLKGGRVYLNGEILREPYLPSGTMTWAGPDRREQLCKLGKDEFFLLGDNRPNSADSRIYGPVRTRNILGLLVH
jgi:signal peptidase I